MSLKDKVPFLTGIKYFNEAVTPERAQLFWSQNKMRNWNISTWRRVRVYEDEEYCLLVKASSTLE